MNRLFGLKAIAVASLLTFAVVMSVIRTSNVGAASATVETPSAHSSAVKRSGTSAISLSPPAGTTSNTITSKRGGTSYAFQADREYGVLGPAVAAFQQAFWSRDLTRESTFPRSNAARDAIFPFNPDMMDASPANLAKIEQRAREGSDLALGAFLLMAAGEPDYTARSHDILLHNAAHGSALALTTLAQYAASGYGFDRADTEAALFYEFLAWRTGQWMPTEDKSLFVPSLTPSWSTAQCKRAMMVAQNMLNDSESSMFSAWPLPSDKSCLHTIQG